jgi:hypothetical protein
VAQAGCWDPGRGGGQRVVLQQAAAAPLRAGQQCARAVLAMAVARAGQLARGDPQAHATAAHHHHHHLRCMQTRTVPPPPPPPCSPHTPRLTLWLRVAHPQPRALIHAVTQARHLIDCKPQQRGTPIQVPGVCHRQLCVYQCPAHCAQLLPVWRRETRAGARHSRRTRCGRYAGTPGHRAGLVDAPGAHHDGNIVVVWWVVSVYACGASIGATCEQETSHRLTLRSHSCHVLVWCVVISVYFAITLSSVAPLRGYAARHPHHHTTTARRSQVGRQHRGGRTPFERVGRSGARITFE